MATKKTEAQVKAAMEKVEAAKVAEAAKEIKKSATATKATEKKPTTTKAAEKKPATKTTEKKPATTKAAEKKPATKTTAAKKAPAKKTTKVTQTVYIQCYGYEVTTADVTEKVVTAIGKTNVKELNIYIKPEEGMIYYTADGEQGSVAL